MPAQRGMAGSGGAGRAGGADADRSSGGRPRLVVVFPHVLLGGGERAMMEVAEGLRDDFRLEVCALDYAPLHGEATTRRELTERFGEVAFLTRRWQLRPLLARAEIALWYGLFTPVPRALAALRRRPASIRVVHTERELDGLRFHRAWHRVVDGTVCVVPAVARRLPNAAFIPNTCAAESLAGEGGRFFPGAPPGRKTLGFLGRLAPLKNVPWLLEHLRELDCNLLIQALDTPWLTVAELRRMAGRLGVGGRVRFLPPGRRVGTLLRSVDALVLASRSEGLPMVVVEAGMLGVPVVAPRIGALPELFADEIHWVDSRGGRPTVASMRRAVAGLDRERGGRLRSRVRRLCSRRAVTARYRDFIRQVHGARLADLAAAG